eukprot:TRINITY_DN40445_c1_g2_i1.p1 TRINITY_DN40445_c1_g2~~TRINITY_DN40445_c1_g2_i1.p1  ORF type:complete len:102 (+),score=7.23 TRINITY_DN40445_c1_g2_i1:585-890(+)
MTDAKHFDLYPPLSSNTRRTVRSLFSDSFLCKTLAGHLIYLTMTLPNISHAAQVVNHFCVRPTASSLECCTSHNQISLWNFKTWAFLFKSFFSTTRYICLW